jgi:hypothetical protein
MLREKYTKGRKIRHGIVAHICNSSYWGGLQFKANLGKKLARPHLNKNVR